MAEGIHDRGDLSGIVYDISGDMIAVRFIEGSDHAGESGRFRLVVRTDGSLSIDPSGLAVRAPRRAEQPVIARAGAAIEAGQEVMIDAANGLVVPWKALPPPEQEAIDGLAEEQ